MAAQFAQMDLTFQFQLNVLTQDRDLEHARRLEMERSVACAFEQAHELEAFSLTPKKV